MSAARARAAHVPVTPVLTFLISLRHPTNSADYGRVEDLARRTLRSLAAQTDRRCAAVVVTNRPLELPPRLPLDVQVVVVDFPPPSAHPGPSTGREAVLLDKGTKLAASLSVVRSKHVMFVDADDFVNAEMTAFVGSHPQSKGWYVEHGLVLEEKSRLYYAVDHFNELCGTSLITRIDLLPRAEFSPAVSQQELLRALGERAIKENFGSHRYLADRLSLQPLPFVGAAYVVGTGENHSGKAMLRIGRPFTNTMARRFGVGLRGPWASCGYLAVRGCRLLIKRLRSQGGAVLGRARRAVNAWCASSSGGSHEN